MTPRLKNILIIGGVAIVLGLGYLFFIKKAPEQPALTTSTESSTAAGISALSQEGLSNDFVSILLSVKSIKLDDTILKDTAFLSLKDSSIVLVPSGNEGRPNPFAPIGTEAITPPTSSVSSTPPPVVTPPLPVAPQAPVTPQAPVIPNNTPN